MIASPQKRPYQQTLASLTEAIHVGAGVCWVALNAQHAKAWVGHVFGLGDCTYAQPSSHSFAYGFAAADLQVGARCDLGGFQCGFQRQAGSANEKVSGI